MSTQFHSLPVKQVKKETEDTVSVSFEVPEALNNTFQYKQGQYLTLRFDIDGKEVRRAYSMSSSPLEKEITVTVKRVPNGLVSNHIGDNITSGSKVEVMAPDGRFFTALNADQQKTYYLFGAGSGITPLMSILKTILEAEPKSTVNLLYGNRNSESIIFKADLDELERKYAGQLNVKHTLSQPIKKKAGGLGGFFKKAVTDWKGETGRIDAQKVNVFLSENPARTNQQECFICGPNSMIDVVEAALIGQGIEKNNIHTERFTSKTDKVDAAISSVEANTGAEVPMVAVLDGKRIEVTVAPGKTILDTLLDLGYEPPYSCTSGSCSTCMAKVKKGTARMEVCYALDDDEVEEGYILTCQAFPTSNEIEVDFDM